MNVVDPNGKNPIFSTTGVFLGVDDLGLQGPYIVMLPENYTPGMPNEKAMLYDLGNSGLEDDEARERLLETYSLLCERPDWDGYLTLKEANDWYRLGGGETLYTDLSKIDLSGVYYWGKETIGKSKVVNLLSASDSINDGLVYGKITLKTTSYKTVRAFSDKYDFDIKPMSNPENWGRNFSTIIGRNVAGEGTPFEIVMYGSAQVNSLFPWVKYDEEHSAVLYKNSSDIIPPNSFNAVYPEIDYANTPLGSRDTVYYWLINKSGKELIGPFLVDDYLDTCEFLGVSFGEADTLVLDKKWM